MFRSGRAGVTWKCAISGPRRRRSGTDNPIKSYTFTKIGPLSAAAAVVERGPVRCEGQIRRRGYTGARADSRSKIVSSERARLVSISGVLIDMTGIAQLSRARVYSR